MTYNVTLDVNDSEFADLKTALNTASSHELSLAERPDLALTARKGCIERADRYIQLLEKLQRR